MGVSEEYSNLKRRLENGANALEENAMAVLQRPAAKIKTSGTYKEMARIRENFSDLKRHEDPIYFLHSAVPYLPREKERMALEKERVLSEVYKPETKESLRNLLERFEKYDRRYGERAGPVLLREGGFN